MAQPVLIPHINHALVAQTHPPMYLIHKYWARKPHNVVRQYVEHYSRSLEIVLDPFCGSGVTCAEAIRLGRKAVGIDIDPIATFITRLTAVPKNKQDYEAAFVTIQQNVRDTINKLYETECQKCKSPAVIVCTRFSKGKPTGVRNYFCPRCGKQGMKQLTVGDKAKIEQIEKRRIPFWYPKDVRLSYADGRPFKKREKSEYVHDLFTKRNLIALSTLLEQIAALPDGITKDLMVLTFSSCIVQASKMVLWSASSRPSWKVHSYWIPPSNVELNVWDRFENRFQTVSRALDDSQSVSKNCREGDFSEIVNGDKTFLAVTQSALDLKTKPAEIGDETIDYVFTDPPYGGSVQYMELSTIWAAWLSRIDQKFQMRYEDEVTINDSQNKDFDFYHKMLGAAFSEVFRVLKKGRWLTVTFHNTDIKIYNSIIKAVVLAGFELEKIVYQPPAKRGAKQQLQPYGAAVGDYYIRFRKPTTERSLVSQTEIDRGRYEHIVVEAVKKVIAQRGEPTPYSLVINSYSDIYEELKANGYLFSAPENIEDVLKRHIGKEFVLESGKWWLKEPSSVAFLQRVPLAERVEKAVINVLNRKVKASFDEILQEVFLNFPNALTPDTSSVQVVLKEYAKKTPDKKWMLKPSVKLRESEHDIVIELIGQIGEALDFEVIADIPKRRAGKLPFDCLNPDRVLEIDAIWLKDSKARYEFEVENTTGITDGLIRGTNLPDGGVKRIIVIPEERTSLLKRRLREEHIRELIEQYHWKFTYYSDIQAMYASWKGRKKLGESDLERILRTPTEIRVKSQGKLEQFQSSETTR